MDRRSKGAAAAALAAVVVLGLAAQAQAATFTVGLTADTGGCASPPAGNNCTLRQLVNSVPADSTIVVPSGLYSLTGGELLIEQNLTIVGAGARTTDIQHDPASGTARVFDVQPNPTSGVAPTVSISGIEASFGSTTSSGGNILNNRGNLTLSEDLIDFGQTTGGSGAGIANVGGTLTLTHSLLKDNSSLASSGSGGTAGAIDNIGSGTAVAHLTLDTSTLFGNSATAGPGAIWSRCTRCTSTASITNSTIASNDGGTAATNAGGILAAATTTVSVQASIVASNTVGGTTPSNCAGATQITSLGHNLETATDCGFRASGDFQGTDPRFLIDGPSDSGGNTDTVPLAANSPAVDAIPVATAGCSGTDQRDVARPQGTACDIGAYELTQQVEGQRFSEVLGSFSSDSTNFSIDWGDGDSADTTGSINGSTGELTGTHTYTDAGTYHGFVHFRNSDGNQTTPFDVKVLDAPLASAGSPITAIAGRPFTGSVATLTDANPSGKVSDFTATITWGDGTATPGAVSAGPGGSFTVTGPHTYANAGTYPTTISIADVDGATTTAHGIATVGAPPSPVGAAPSPVTTGAPVVKGSTAASFSGSVNPNGLATSAHFEYGLDRRYITPDASGPQYDHTTPSQLVGADFTSHNVSASVSGLVPNALYHVRLVATNGAGTTNGPDVTFTTARGPTPGAPGLGKTFNVSATGLVLIKVHGVFIPLTELTKIPNGTIINALHGTLTLTTAATGGGTQHATLSANAKRKKKPKKPKTQTGKFGGAVFKVTQARSGLATVALVEGAFKGAPSFATCKTKKGKAIAATLSKKTLQLLHGSAHGKFRSKGRYAAATVRGTIWTIADRCDGTLTHAIKDTVTVNDFVRHKTIILRPGHSYLALAKPPHKRK